jgi:hypothetical protein
MHSAASFTESRFLIMDRDRSFHAAFRGLLESAGVQPVRTPVRSPNCNAHLEKIPRFERNS